MFLGTQAAHLLWKGQHFHSQPWHPAEVAGVLQPSVSSQVWETRAFSATASLSGRCPWNLPARNLPTCQGSTDPSGHQVLLIKAETQATYKAVNRPFGLATFSPSNIWTLTTSLGLQERGIGLWGDLWTSSALESFR